MLKAIETIRTVFQILAVFKLSEIGTANAFVSLNTEPGVKLATLHSLNTASTDVSDTTAPQSNSKVKHIGLLTFDLDDTLYPIATVVDDANCELLSHQLYCYCYCYCCCYLLFFESIEATHCRKPTITIIVPQFCFVCPMSNANDCFCYFIAAFVTAMERFGFDGVDAFSIVTTGKTIREELAESDPEAAAGL